MPKQRVKKIQRALDSRIAVWENTIRDLSTNKYRAGYKKPGSMNPRKTGMGKAK